jgi:hypothetical protein
MSRSRQWLRGSLVGRLDRRLGAVWMALSVWWSGGYVADHQESRLQTVAEQQGNERERHVDALPATRTVPTGVR